MSEASIFHNFGFCLGQLTISLDMAKQMEEKLLKVVPGWKLCRSCNKQFIQYDHKDYNSQSDEEVFAADEDSNHDPSFEKVATKKQKLDISFNAMDLSPVKLHSIAQHQRVTSAETKLKKAVKKMHATVAEVYNVDVSDIGPCQSRDTIDASTKKKAENFDQLMGLIKEKLKNVDFKTKIQVLTLTPESWSRKYAAEYFNVSEYLIRKGHEQKREKGVLSMPNPKSGKQISIENINLIETFYQDDENSRLMPGKKDYVAVKGRGHEQKRLLLCNLHELYVLFKETYRDFKIGFSKFCTLRPKWCVNVGASGTHSVCVCTHHQNAILLVNAIKWKVTHKTLMEKLVCDVTKNECMVHRCENCPGTEALKSFLDEELKDMEPEEEFYFNQWQTTDRTTLITQTVSLEDYKELLISYMDRLTSHSYITKCQGKYLKDKKEELTVTECIVLGDFAENYKFHVQDEIQSYHWNSEQCTLHPIVLYFKIDGDIELQKHSICFISDDMEHDTAFVYETQKHVTNYIKDNLPLVSKIYYFSDGCGGQYKNYKNFLNLCNHKNDFGLVAEWIFFATSHGKSPCDGIGGTVKRLTARASLQRPLDKQILSVDKMFEFCCEKIKNINFINIKSDHMVKCARLSEQTF